METETAPVSVRNNFLLKYVRILLNNETRILYGTLVCVDRSGNAVLQDVIEQRLDADNQIINERSLQLIMIPGKHIAQVSVYDNAAPVNLDSVYA